MDARDILIKLLHKKLSNNGFKPVDYVFDYDAQDNICTVSFENTSATVLFKICVESDVKSMPLLLSVREIFEKTFNYKSLGNFNQMDVSYYNQMHTFDTDLFNETYHECCYDDLDRIFRCFPEGKVALKFSEVNCSVVSIDLLKSVFLGSPDRGDVFLKSNCSDSPVFVAYDYYYFKVYAVIAPLIVDSMDADVIFRP